MCTGKKKIRNRTYHKKRTLCNQNPVGEGPPLSAARSLCPCATANGPSASNFFFFSARPSCLRILQHIWSNRTGARWGLCHKTTALKRMDNISVFNKCDCVSDRSLALLASSEFLPSCLAYKESVFSTEVSRSKWQDPFVCLSVGLSVCLNTHPQEV